MTSFIEIPIETNPQADEQALYDQLADYFPGWDPAEGNLEVWLARWWAQTKADLAELVADVSGEIFHRYGETIIGLPPIAAAPATGTVTWTAVDTTGYTIPADTQIEVMSGDEGVAFITTAAVVIAPGDTAEDGPVAAVVEGAEANGLTGPTSLIDALAFVDTVALTGATSGGVDAETADAYRNRLAAELQLMGPRPILPEDAATMARRVAGVHRALAIDGYDPTDTSYGNERTCTVAVVDADGEACSPEVKAEVDALLEAEREINFLFFVIDPTYTTIKVTASAVALPGYTAADVDTAATEALANYLSPATWGLASVDEDTAWRPQGTVRRNELISVIDRAPGVDYVVDVTLATEAGTLGTADVPLTGAAPLPRPGTLNVTVTSP